LSKDEIRYSHGPKFLDLLMKNSNGSAYRKRVEPCPFCERDAGWFEKSKFAREWHKEENVREVVFIRDTTGGIYYKKGQAIIVSACPRCKKLSFHHISIGGSLLRKDWVDKEIVQAEIDAWEQETLDEWNLSLCKRCIHVKEVDKDKFGYYVVCDGRMGSPSQPDEEEPFLCTQFKEAEKNV